MARPREFDEEAILTSASEQFWTKGYAGTTMEAIAGATGLGKGSLYGAFGGKQELFLRIFDEYCTSVTQGVASGLTGPDEDAYARLCAHIRAATAAVAGDSLHRGCLLAKGAAELSEHSPEVLARSSRAFEHITQSLAHDVRAAQRSGDLDPAVDATSLASLVLAVLRGVEALGKAGVGPQQLENITETAIGLLPRTGAKTTAATSQDAADRNTKRP